MTTTLVNRPVVRVTTATGSIYQIDYARHHWQRLHSTPTSGAIRTDAGEFIQATQPIVGRPIFFLLPPLHPDQGGHPQAVGRMIHTSPIVSVEQTQSN